MMDQFLAWLRPESTQQPAMAPAEAMLLKSKPHFVQCRELRSQVSDLIDAAIAAHYRNSRGFSRTRMASEEHSIEIYPCLIYLFTN